MTAEVHPIKKLYTTYAHLYDCVFRDREFVPQWSWFRDRRKECHGVRERCTLDPKLNELLDRIDDRHLGEQPALQLAEESQQHLALAQTKRKAERLLELRLAGEISAEEYQTHKAEVQSELALSELALQDTQEKQQRDERSLEHLVRFCTTASRDFEGGVIATKRAIATALSDRYLLTLGELRIQPHPLLEQFRTFEPPKSALQQVYAGQSTSANPELRRR